MRRNFAIGGETRASKGVGTDQKNWRQRDKEWIRRNFLRRDSE
jgi:hypothetical protein